MTFLYEYLMFLGQVVTLVIGFIVVASFLASLGSRAQSGSQGHLQVQKLNEQIRDLRFSMESHLLTSDQAKKQHKSELKAEKAEQKKAAKRDAKKQSQKEPVKAVDQSSTDDAPEADSASDGIASIHDGSKPRTFVIHFDGDVAASAVEHLRIEVTAVLTMAQPQDEVVVCIESPGGMVHSYGLAASQMMRIRSKGIPLTALVDRVAASGGYLMAAVANKIVAAPFAVIGSIGVVAQVPNVHRLLKKNDVDVEVLTAGKYKRTLTLLGENTDEGREKFREELEEVHTLFQEFVVDNRPELDIEAVATGEAWYGSRALDLRLVDALATSDEYVSDQCQERDVYSVAWVEVKKPLDRLLDKANGALDRVNHMLEFVRK
jgi:serine protease SohB